MSSMRGIDTQVRKIRRQVFKEVANLAYTSENLKDDTFVYGKALECLDKALDIYRTFMFEEKSYRARSEAEGIHLHLSQAVAYMNHTYADSPIFNERQAYDNTPEIPFASR